MSAYAACHVTGRPAGRAPPRTGPRLRLTSIPTGAAASGPLLPSRECESKGFGLPPLGASLLPGSCLCTVSGLASRRRFYWSSRAAVTRKPGESAQITREEDRKRRLPRVLAPVSNRRLLNSGVAFTQSPSAMLLLSSLEAVGANAQRYRAPRLSPRRRRMREDPRLVVRASGDLLKVLSEMIRRDRPAAAESPMEGRGDVRVEREGRPAPTLRRSLR